MASNVVTIVLASEESFALPDGNSAGVKKLTVRATSANNTSVTGSAYVIISGVRYGGDDVDLTSSDPAATIESVSGESIQGITIENDTDATCQIILYT